MAEIYEKAFRIRHYECDAQGRLHAANYLRYIQETALDASAAVGYDIPRYDQLQRRWLIRETALTVSQPLTYDTNLCVKTWVEDFRRVRSRRAYELRDLSTGAVVAQAHSDWVFLDQNSLRPVTVPQAMIDAFLPEGLPGQTPPRQKFPRPAAPASAVMSKDRPVQWSDIDAIGHVNNAVYLEYIEDCAHHLLSDQPWPAATTDFPYLQQARIEYKMPALPADTIRVSTYFSEINEETAVAYGTVNRKEDNGLLAHAHLTFGR